MKILVVEDEHKIAHAIKKGLENERMVVDLAYNKTDGYDLAVSEEYNVLLIDWMLPDGSGVDLIIKLRGQNIHTPILLLTAKGQIEDKVIGLDTGADDYMTKPFAFSELVSRVRALSRRPKETSDEVLKIDNLILNVKTFDVKRGNTTLTLSAKEFSLLEYLLRHQNQIIPKQQLIDHVWNYESDILPNTVEVYIKKLREKIDSDQNMPLIHTIRGFGYRLGENGK